MDLNLINGISSKYIDILNKMNIFSIEDLLMYYPFRYEVIGPSRLVESNEVIYVVGRVYANPRVSYIKKNFNRLNFKCLVSNTLLDVVIFNRAFYSKSIILGRDITLVGKYDSKKNSFVCNDILFEKLEDKKIVPIYHLVNGITNKMLSSFVKKSISYCSYLNDSIPSYISNKYEFLNKSEAVKHIHLPSNTSIYKKAKIRLIYEELFMFLFKINYLKTLYKKNNAGIARVVSYEKVMEFVNNLPFSLTVDQLSALDDVYNDLCSSKRMNRLILGDVGSGKTIISVIAMYINCLSNMQSTLMVPTEILAKQHYENLSTMFKPYGIKVGLLVSGMKKKDKDLVIKSIENGEVDIVIGTHAILNDKVNFLNLSLVITDEQHRFGVNQRGSLQGKGISTDILYMSATPIPRTYALTVYGDMDTTMIKTKPNGRKEIITKVVKESNLKEVLYQCLEVLKNGQQIYVVAPLIETNEEMELNDVNLLYDKFNKAFNEKVKVDILHGKMKQKEKDSIMESFVTGKTKILISTTVIEVGVDVKNSTMMIIFNAERFGLATLHQLRGRVGRNDLQSYCYLVCDYDVKRLAVLESSNDGFYISEKDFEMRGQGDLFGIKQSGDMSFKIADIRNDSKILMQAKKDVDEFIKLNVNDNFKNYQVYNDIVEKLFIVD